MAEAGELTLFYGDESHVCQEGYVPYGWQFPGEDVFIPAQKGARLNCWGLFSRDNQCHWATTTQNITAAFVAEKLESLSLQVTGPTVVVLDHSTLLFLAADFEQVACGSSSIPFPPSGPLGHRSASRGG